MRRQNSGVCGLIAMRTVFREASDPTLRLNRNKLAIREAADGLRSVGLDSANESRAIGNRLVVGRGTLRTLVVSGGYAQDIEFDPDGNTLFVGSAFTNRIEVFDVLGDFELRKDPKFLKARRGDCSLTVGPTFGAKD